MTSSEKPLRLVLVIVMFFSIGNVRGAAIDSVHQTFLNSLSDINREVTNRCGPARQASCSVVIQAYSAYKNDINTCTNPVAGYVDVNGARVWNGGWCTSFPNPRGVTLMIIDPFSCRLTGSKLFDTHMSQADTDDLAAYLSYLRDGAIVVGVTGDEPTRLLSSVTRTLRVAGVYVDDVQHRGNFAFILQKGYPEKTLYSKALTNTVPAARLAARILGSTVDDLTITAV